MIDGSRLTALAPPLTLPLSPQTGRGDTPSPANAGEGWGEGERKITTTSVNYFYGIH